MAKRMMKLTVEEVRANIPYDLICMVRYGCTWSSGRRRRAWLADLSRKTFHLWQKLGDFCASI